MRDIKLSKWRRDDEERVDKLKASLPFNTADTLVKFAIKNTDHKLLEFYSMSSNASWRIYGSGPGDPDLRSATQNDELSGSGPFKDLY